jgi:hypothetical protein
MVKNLEENPEEFGCRHPFKKIKKNKKISKPTKLTHTNLGRAQFSAHHLG